MARAQNREHQIELVIALRCSTEDMESVADLDVLDLTQPPVDVQHQLVELLVGGPFGQPQIVVHLGGGQQRPDLLAYRRQLRGVQRGDGRMLVDAANRQPRGLEGRHHE